MPKIKKRMRQALALFFSLFFFLTPFFQKIPQVYAADMCCDDGFTLANGSPAALAACNPTGVGANAYNTTQCCRRTGGLNIETIPSHVCNPGTNLTPTCEWSALNNASLPAYNGKPAFCFGNFNSADDLKSHRIEFQCVGPACGGLFDRGVNALTGKNNEWVSLADLSAPNIGANNGTNYSCITGDLDANVFAVYQANLRNRDAACILELIGGGATGQIQVSIKAVGAAGAKCQAELAALATPGIEGNVVDSSGKTVCTATLPISLVTSDSNTTTNNNTFDLCNQVPDPTLRSSCQSCNTQYGGTANTPKAIWTSVGCIPTTTTGIVTSLVKLGLGIAGTVALLMILAGGFMLSTSQGDTKRVCEARELITSAVIGLLFIIFSVTLLQFIGVSIFQIPGFGS